VRKQELEKKTWIWKRKCWMSFRCY
jgi:hypothetical protein